MNPVLNQEVLVILLTLIFSAFFSGMEIAFISANRLKIELDKKHGTFSSRIISVFTSNPSRFISSLLVGNNIALVIYGISVAKLLEPFLFNKLSIQSDIAILILQTLIGTIVILFTGEFMPKTIFRSRPNSSLNFFALPSLILYYLLYPVTQIIIWITSFILRFVFQFRTRIREESQDPIFGKVDLDHLVHETQTVEEVKEGEPEMKIFQNVLAFSQLKVRDCMVPRAEITAIEYHTSVSEITQKFIETGYSKIPVYKETIDNIIGYISSKDLYKGAETIKSRLVPLNAVPESMHINKLFSVLIKERKSMALVVDEYGGTSGIITLEDIMEEIFGEIEDEHDTSEFIEKQISPNEFILSGRLEIDYLNDKYKLDLPESDEYDTLAGFIIYHAGSIPEKNSAVRIDNKEVKILKVSQTRIELVHLILYNT